MTITEDLNLNRDLLSIADLNALHSLELTECYEANPSDNPHAHSHPLTALREAHRKEWDRRAHPTGHVRKIKDEDLESPQSPESHQSPSEVIPTPQRGTERLCRDCGVLIPPTGKRGKPPVRCAPCRGVA